ncbi:Aquaporin-9 [Rhizopus stolonifer]|uniref:Aquaporin-9 n=1 Tax=Rhizopus stolonifer TaxID=4846 RepID=A0A367K2D0_RHIST|nr:Aquaporin-9 [Rhizopus stolonifer]
MSLGDDSTINERDPLLSSDQRQEYNSGSQYKFNNDVTAVHNTPIDGNGPLPFQKDQSSKIEIPQDRNTTRSYDDLKDLEQEEFLAEFIGTLVLVFLTCGFCAEQTLNIENSKSWLTSSLGSGLSVLIAICIAGHVSGGHLNPAITIAFTVFSGFPIRKAPSYIAAQFLGAFTGAALLYTIVEPAITQFDHGKRQILGELGTASIFGTYPPLYVGTGSAVVSEIMGTALLLMVVMVTGHPNNLPFRTAQGAMIALGITTISLCIGYTSGFSLNPARDFGPRLFTAVAGWGLDVFRVHHYYALVPMFSPILGGLLGGFIYTVFID